MSSANNCIGCQKYKPCGGLVNPADYHADGEDRMRFREYQPPLSLKPYLRYYWTLQLNSIPVSNSSQRLLTEGFELTFNLAAPIEIINCDGKAKCISETGITGPMSRPMKLRPTGPVNLFGIC